MRVAIERVNVSPEGRKRDRTSATGLDIFKQVAEEGDIGAMVAVEKAFNQVELEHSPTAQICAQASLKASGTWKLLKPT